MPEVSLSFRFFFSFWDRNYSDRSKLCFFKRSGRSHGQIPRQTQARSRGMSW